MIIQKLRLENVKSYQETEIRFAPGVNLICGNNGAGKSTIIEAIGYALFGVQPPMKKEEFIRTGRKSCLVQVWFTASAKSYLVERTMRASGGAERWTVFEDERQVELHGRADVLPFLQEALGIPPGGSAQQLFSQMIAVGQNDFLTPFLLTPAMRTAQFNGILGVESYRTASDGLRFAEKELEEGENRIRLAMAPFAESRRRLEEFRTLQKTAEERAAQRAAEWCASVERFDILKQLELIEQEESGVEELIQSCTQRQHELEAIRSDAQRSKPSYDAYLELEQKLAHLSMEIASMEEERMRLKDRRDLLAQEKAKGERALEEAAWQDERLRQELLAAEERENRFIQEQGTLLEEKKRASAAVAALEGEGEILSETERHGEELLAGGRHVRNLIRRIREKAEAIRSMGDLDALRQSLQERRRIETIRQENCRQLEDALLQAAERMEYLKAGADEMAAGRCPVAGVDCPLPCADFDAMCSRRMAELCTEREMREKELQTLMERVDGALEAEEAAWLKEHHRALELKKEMAAGREELEAVLHGLREHAGEESHWLEECLDRMDEVDGDRFLARVEEIAKGRRERLEASIQQLYEAKSRETSVNERFVRICQECMSVAAERTRLGQAREELAGRKTELAQTLGGLQADQAEQAYAAYEAAYGERIAEQREFSRRMREIRGDYETYLSCESQLREEKGVLERIISLEKRRKELNREKAEWSGRLSGSAADGETVQDAGQRAQEAARLMGEANAALEQAREHAAHAEEQAIRYDELEGQLKRKGEVLKLMGELRDVLRRAAGPMADAIRKQVSAVAGDTYRAISGEGSALIWDATFDIVLSDTFDGVRRNRRFQQLSGGEKMTSALAVRLALIRTYSNLAVAFFDEPTSNLDAQRRARLGEMIPKAVEGFDQLFFISHDDSFYNITENAVFLEKSAAGTVVKSQGAC